MLTLKEAREAKGVKQSAVADAINVSRQTYAKYEESPGKMPISKAAAACRFIGCDINEIFFSETFNLTEQ